MSPLQESPQVPHSPLRAYDIREEDRCGRVRNLFDRTAGMSVVDVGLAHVMARHREYRARKPTC